MIIVIITTFVLSIGGEYQSEMELISRLNDCFDFDHHIFLLDPSVDADRFVNSTDFTPRTLLTLKSVDDENESTADLTTIGSKNTFMILVPSESSVDFDSNFTNLHRIKNIQRLQVNMKIGIFFLEFTPIENIRKLFKWCRQELIVNIFAVTNTEVNHANSLNIFAFHPFKAFDVMNVTAYTNQSIFPSLDFNFHQHRLRASNEYDTSDDVFWDIVLSHMNASPFKIVDENFDVSHGIHTQRSPEQLNVYTLEQYSQVVIIPEASSYSDFSTYSAVILSSAYFGYFVILLVGLIVLLVIIRHINQQKLLLFESMADVINLLMNDNSAVKYPQLPRSEMYLIVPLTFVGLVVVNGVLSIFQSYVTRPIDQPQIKTVNEIYEHKIPILTWNLYWKDITVSALKDQSKFNDWDDKVLMRDWDTVTKQIWRYNRSAAYVVFVYWKDALIKVQKSLKMKGFYDPRIVVGCYLSSYRVGDSFIFIDRLNEIIHRYQSSGLYELRDRQFTAGQEKYILQQLQNEIKENSPSLQADTLSDFPISIVYGWFCSAIVLVSEILWKKLQLLRLKNVLIKS